MRRGNFSFVIMDWTWASTPPGRSRRRAAADRACTAGTSLAWVTTVAPAELAAALRAAGLAEIDTATRRRAEYSSDASNYRVVPAVVAFPRHADEIVAALSVCRELGVPIVPRGGGTSIAGNSLSTGVVLDLSRYLNRVVSIDAEEQVAVAEPGTVLDSITAAAAPHGLRFGPDPSTHSRATIGGAIGNNACGSRALRYGRTADNVIALDVVTGTGTRFTAGRGRGQGRRPAVSDPAAPAAELLTGLHTLVDGNLATIRTEFGRFTRQVSGYSLEHLLPENGADVAKFLSGTEGTLALTLLATVRLVAAPRATALAVLGYPDMAAAAEAVPALLPHLPVALEGLDSRMVDVVRTRRGPAAVPGLPRGGGWLFAETAGDTLEEARAAAGKLVADGGCLDSAVITGPAAAALWRIREDGAGLGGRTPAGAPAWPGWEDSAVPPTSLPAYLRELAARLAASYGGSASGEHGDGRARGELLPAMYSATAIGLFGAVKELFDPANLLNPGVIVDPAPLDADLRVPLAPPLRRNLGFAYPHDRGDFSSAVHRCTGVGKCRADNTDSGGVMCPSYLATRDEKDSTRGRARVLQELANGSLVSSGWQSPEVAEALDLCLSCKGCSTDCPAGVDMATYKAEALYQRYRGRRRPMAHYSLGWLPRWAALAPRSFRRWMRSRQSGLAPQTQAEPVLLWVDTFTNAFAPQVGQAAVQVLEAAGYEVMVTGQHVCCGLTWISTGQLDGARRQLRKTLRALAPALDAGIPVVGLEPSCTAALRRDAGELLPGDSRAAALSRAVRTLAELLESTEGWAPPDMSDISGSNAAVAQPHCHQHAVLGWEADAALLRAAGATVNAVGGCCGLA